MTGKIEEDVLRALRRINRLVDLQSRRLVSQFGLTGPQLVCLRTISELDETTPSALSREISLSQATITGVVDRLVSRKLVERERSEMDRRQVTIRITAIGRDMVATVPSPLQERFVNALTDLSTTDQERIRFTLGQIIEMMGGEDIPAEPILTAEPLPNGDGDAEALAKALGLSAPEHIADTIRSEDEGEENT